LNHDFIVFIISIAAIAGFAMGIYEVYTKRLAQERAEEERRLQRLRREQELQRESQQLRKISMQLKRAASELPPTSLPTFKSSIEAHEQQLIAQGGAEAVTQFMRVNAFLFELYNQIEAERAAVSQLSEQLRNKNSFNFIYESAQSRQTKAKFDRMLRQLGVKAAAAKHPLLPEPTSSFKKRVERILRDFEGYSRYDLKTLGVHAGIALNDHQHLLSYYSGMASAMLAFYAEGRMTRYAEIYLAFEKLAVFQTHWEKQVVSKLKHISNQLLEISDQIAHISDEFSRIEESNHLIVSELEDIQSSVSTTNAIAAINAYQTYRIHRNLKSIAQRR
jgi:hypothetical protein